LNVRGQRRLAAKAPDVRLRALRIEAPGVTPTARRRRTSPEKARVKQTSRRDSALRKGSGIPERERLSMLLALIAIALERRRFRAAAMAVATELATRLGLERVSIGFERGGRMQVEALSHSASFDPRSSLIRDLGAAMDEACDQDATLLHPPPEGTPPHVVRAHQRLVGQHGIGAACTVPLTSGGRIVGALTLEQAEGSRIHADALRLCEEAASTLGPLLDLERKVEAGPLARLRAAIAESIVRVARPGHPAARLAAVAGVVTFVLLGVMPGTHRVTADATLEGLVQRAVVAGVDGYVAEASARAGDVVRQGQVLARLDERDLVLERRQWTAGLDQLRKEYREALSAHDRTQLNILQARIAQSRAQLALLDENLARTRLIAPFDGVIVQGDLSRSLGAPVEKGTLLFEVAPLDGYRIVLDVDERDVAHVTSGKRGQLALSAMPGEPLPLAVEKITPVSSVVDGRNVFRVEASLLRPVTSLRPGMEGVAKIEIGRRRLVWIWTHEPFERLRLWAWSWWP
jgi:RND family efflux transporter MFP subunit